MGCAGTPELETPTLDRLAAEGMRFQNCFCASPVCSPARASFLTGRIPSSHGVHDWIKSGNIEVEDGVTWCGKDRSTEYLAGKAGHSEILARMRADLSEWFRRYMDPSRDGATLPVTGKGQLEKVTQSEQPAFFPTCYT